MSNKLRHHQCLVKTLTSAAQVAAIQVSGTTTLPGAVLGQSYRHQLTASNGVAPIRWPATGLPSGLVLDHGTGLLSGTPTASGEFNLGILTSDQTGRRGWVGMHLNVRP